MLLVREDGSLVQWLHVSKYPPSLSYIALELGLMCLCLAALFQLSARGEARHHGVFLVLGQTPMFFYLLHFPMLVLASKALGVEHKLGLGATYLGAALVVAALYPFVWCTGATSSRIRKAGPATFELGRERALAGARTPHARAGS